MNRFSFRSKTSLTMAVCGLLLALGVTLPQHAQKSTALLPHEACCGTISPEGYRLAAVIDGMHVEQNWLAHKHVNWETGAQDRPDDYAGKDAATHCSAFAAAVGERLGVYMLRPPEHPMQLLANAQAHWFDSGQGEAKGWKPLTGEGHEAEVQRLANQGNLVMIIYENPDPHRPGHVVVVRPSLKSPQQLEAEGPEVAMAATTNRNDWIAARSFTSHAGAWPNGVQYFWHPVDWAKVPEAPVAAK